MGITVETYLKYSNELLKVLPFVVSGCMWLISISKKNHANNSSCEKCGFLQISNQF